MKNDFSSLNRRIRGINRRVRLPFRKLKSFSSSDIILFTFSSESYLHSTVADTRVIGGKSDRSPLIVGMPITDTVSIPDSELSLFCDSLLRIRENAAVIPLENKVLVVYNKLLRALGLGVAIVLDIAPESVAELIREGGTDIYANVLFSKGFGAFIPDSTDTAGFTRELSYYLGALDSAFYASKDGRATIDRIITLIETVAELTDCATETDAATVSGHRKLFDPISLTAFMLCFFSSIHSLSGDKTARIIISEKELFHVSVSFSPLSNENIDRVLHSAHFCEAIALERDIPFRFDSSDKGCRLLVVPYREDPSLSGLKAGIYIDGKRFSRLQ